VAWTHKTKDKRALGGIQMVKVVKVSVSEIMAVTY